MIDKIDLQMICRIDLQIDLHVLHDIVNIFDINDIIDIVNLNSMIDMECLFNIFILLLYIIKKI